MAPWNGPNYRNIEKVASLSFAKTNKHTRQCLIHYHPICLMYACPINSRILHRLDIPKRANMQGWSVKYNCCSHYNGRVSNMPGYEWTLMQLEYGDKYLLHAVEIYLTFCVTGHIFFSVCQFIQMRTTTFVLKVR